MAGARTTSALSAKTVSIPLLVFKIFAFLSNSPFLGTLKEIAVAGGVENLVNQNRQLLGLENPCPGSAYSAIFKDSAPKGGYSYDMDLEDDTDINSSFH